jgi:hypothetical protein
MISKAARDTAARDRAGWVAVALALAALRCGGGGGGGDDGPRGQLLVTVQANVAGVNYRLRNATMTGSGAQAFTLAADGAAQVSMSQALAPGAYTLELEEGWSLERQMGATFSAVAATLTSPNPVAFSVAAAQVARVGYAFDAGGVDVDLREGADENDDNDD